MLDLLVQVDSHVGEGLPGYLHRLAEANGLSGAFVVDRFKIMASEDDAAINELVGANPGWIEFSREMQTPRTRPMPTWNLRHRRFCPSCLSENSFWRAAWDLSLVTACPIHNIPLRDTCRHCNERFLWKMHIAKCCPRCGRALASADEDLPIADAGEVWLAKELTQRLIASNRHRSQHTKQLGLEDFHELAFRLGACAFRPTARKPLKVQNSGSLDIARPIAVAAARLLRDWPSSFSRGLDRIRADRNSASQWKLGAALGPIYHQIFDGLPGVEFKFVRAAFDNYVQEKWQAPLALRHRNLSSTTILMHRWLPIDEISARLELQPSTVARVVNAGEVASRTKTYKSGRTACVVDSVELGRIADELRVALTAEQAADVLGLKTTRIGQLIQKGLLKVWGGSPAAGAAWLISRRHVTALLAFGARAPVLQCEDWSKISIDHVLRYVVNAHDDFGAIMTGIVNGDVKVVGALKAIRQVGDWIVEREQIERLLNRSRLKNDGELTVVELAEVLGVKQEVAYALVRNGHIRSHEQRSGKRTARFVRSTDIDLFRRDYHFGSALAEVFGKSCKSVVNYLKQRNINPAGGPTVTDRPCRQYYWRRTKRLEMLIRSRDANHDAGC